MEEVSTTLISLNAIRQPEAWKRLSAQEFLESPKSTRGAVLDQIGRDSGMALELPEDPGVGPDWKSAPFAWPFPLTETFSLLRAVEALAEAAGFEAILERDRIRFVTRTKALEFWKSWWEDEQKK